MLVENILKPDIIDELVLNKYLSPDESSNASTSSKEKIEKKPKLAWNKIEKLKKKFETHRPTGRVEAIVRSVNREKE